MVAAAVALLDADGVEGLSMRRLAERLGVTAAALYWHVRDKQELIDLVAEAIVAGIDLPAPGTPWRDALLGMARSSRRVTLSHRDGARVLVLSIPRGEHRLALIETLFETLRAAGCPPSEIPALNSALNSFLTGSLLEESMSPEQNAAPTAPGPAPTVAHPASCRLVVAGGSVNLTIDGDATMPDLYRAAYEGHPPQVSLAGDLLRVRVAGGNRAACHLTLAASSRWSIELSGGVRRVAADLSLLAVDGVRVAGGVSDVLLRLPAASGTIGVQVSGGARRLTLERPAGTALRATIKHGGRRLVLDGTFLSSVGGTTRWESPGAGAATGVVELEVAGGVSDLETRVGPDTGQARIHGQGLPPATPAHPFAGLDPVRYPNLAAAFAELSHPDPERRFEVGLGLLLDGIERRLVGRPPDPEH